jgi:hypothetical protein
VFGIIILVSLGLRGAATKKHSPSTISSTENISGDLAGNQTHDLDHEADALPLHHRTLTGALIWFLGCSTGVTMQHLYVPTISVSDFSGFQCPIGIVALSVWIEHCCIYFLASPWKLPCGVMYFGD